MQFTKIKHKDKETELKWSVPNGLDRELHELVSEDEPERGFIRGLEDLRPIVVRVLELPKEYEEKLDVTTLSIDRDVNKNQGFVISARATVEAGKVSLSTPRLRVPATDGPSGPTQLTEDEYESIEQLVWEAQRYLKGERTQGELPLGDAVKGPETIDAFPEAGGREPELAGAN